jgi:hypothetical protein
MAKFLLLFLQLNVIFRNLPFFFILGCMISVVFPLMYPDIETGAQLSEMANDCAKETYKKDQEDSKAISAIEKCVEYKRTQKNAAQAQK